MHAWRITSQTDLGSLGATPALVGGDPVVVVDLTRQTTTKFLYEYEVLRLARDGGASVRFAINPTGRAMWGSEFVTGVRVGPDGQLYQLRTDRATGASIARYSLDPTKATPPTSAPTPAPPPAPGPPIDHGSLTMPPVTVPPAKPATPAATDPAGSQWLLPSLVAVGTSLLAGLGVWLLYRHRHPASPGPRSQSRMAR